jgi:hypothetical protein
VSSDVPEPILRYLRSLAGPRAPAEASLFWERQLESMPGTQALLDSERPGSDLLDDAVAEAGYGLARLDETGRDAGLETALEAQREIRAKAKEFELYRAEFPLEVAEHAAAIAFLARRDRLDPYLEFMAEIGVRSSMSTARHWWYAQGIKALATDTLGSRPLDLLEIGAGGGVLALFLSRLGLARSYRIVDLPEMLLHSSWTIHSQLPEATLSFGTREGEFAFLTPAQAATLEPDSADIALNANSFMEMDEVQRDSYLRMIGRAVLPGGLLWNVNRRQHLPQRDGTIFDNNPLLYPYPDGEVLVWEADEFQSEVRARHGRVPSMAIMRASRVRARP